MTFAMAWALLVVGVIVAHHYLKHRPPPGQLPPSWRWPTDD